MRVLSNRERLLVRGTAAGISILILFFLLQPLQKRRAEYRRLVNDATRLRQKIEPYAGRAETVKKWMNDFQMDPAKLSRATVVGEASAAIQKAALSSGIQVGLVREDSARGQGKEAASLQFEGTGPVPATMGFIQRLQSLGYPLIIDAVQITPTQPGQVKMNLTIVILDFEQWKSEDQPHA